MRLFVAVDLSDDVRATVARAARDLAERLVSQRPAPSIRWVQPENLHLTLRFLGRVDEARAAAVSDVLARGLEVGAFQVSFSGAGAFPHRGPPKVVWLAVAEGGTELVALHDEIDARLGSVGFVAEPRPYAAHLTLGRVRQPGSGGAAMRHVLAATEVTTSRWLVDHVTLYDSTLSSKGPTYHPVIRTNLT